MSAEQGESTAVYTGNASHGAAAPVVGWRGQLERWAQAWGGMVQITAHPRQAALGHRLTLLLLLALGACLRLWGLGNVGLHGDEETMALAVRSILADGVPILPSGMLYPRGLTQLYLMAMSVQVFGETEWALRLPSALCGVLLIWLVWLAGRRFLTPNWNLALAATVMLLPAALDYSQTARMYIFLLAAVAATLACVFAWERTGKSGWLIAGVLTLCIGVELHTLAVTCALLFLWPGVLRGNLRLLLQGALASAVVLLAYVGIEAWLGSHYPVPPADYAADLGTPLWERTRTVPALSWVVLVGLLLCGAALAAVAWLTARRLATGRIGVSLAALFFASLIAQLSLYYHLAALIGVAVVVLAVRERGAAAWRPLAWYGGAAAVLAIIHLSVVLAAPAGLSLKQAIGALVGQPSIWPYYRIMQFSTVAGMLALVAMAHGLWCLARRQPLADHVLLAVLTVWVPMFVIGFYTWSLPPRYTVASLLPMLLSAMAFAQGMWLQWSVRYPALRPQGTQLLAGVVLAILIANPVAVARVVNAGYEMRPDHQGAALFMRSLQLGPNDVVIAEDILQQTYYLGRVDYWLMSRDHARRYVERVNGRIQDFYTGTPVVSSADLLLQVLEDAAGDVYVVGSGENQADGRRLMRGDMDDVLRSPRFEVIHTGRDGLTQVWRARARPTEGARPSPD